jgi:hypothetical protein
MNDVGSSGQVSVTPHEFLETMFGGDTSGVWTCSYADGLENWTGRAYSGPPRVFSSDWNHYFVIGRMEPGVPRRAKDNVSEVCVFFVDDVGKGAGSKADPDQWQVLFGFGFPEPTAVVETSPGNFTYLWALYAPVPVGQDADPDDVRVKALERLFTEVHTRGLGDKLDDPSRYMRMPFGVNTKEKYRLGANGKFDPSLPAPDVRLVEWRPEATMDVLQAVSVIAGSDWQNTAPVGLAGNGASGGTSTSLVSSSAPLNRTADVNNPDAYMMLWEACGKPLVQVRPGVVETECPFHHDHTTRADTGCAFVGDERIKCSHAHCADKNIDDHKRQMRLTYDGMMAVGLLTDPGLPQTAQEFIGSVRLKQSGMLEDMGQALEDAEAMAARQLAAAEAEEQVAKDAEAEVFERFVSVECVGMFYNTHDQTNAFVTDQSVRRDPLVKAAFGYAGAGSKNDAITQMHNHPDLKHVQTVAYLPGAGKFVQVDNGAGVMVSAVNRWRGPTLPDVPANERPEAWLELLRYVVPDARARRQFVLWFAWAVQNPAKAMTVMPVLIGAQGIGKNQLIEVFLRIMGRNNVAEVSASDLDKDFNAFAEKKVLLFDEIRMTNPTQYNGLKALLTAPRVTINRKYEPPYQITPRYVAIATTNDLDAIRYIDHDDRRIMAYLSPQKPMSSKLGTSTTPGTQLFFERLVPVLESPEEAARLRNYLLSIDRTKHPFHPHVAPDDAHMGDTKEQMRIASQSMAGQNISAMLAPGGHFHGRKYLLLTEVRAMLTGRENSFVTDRQLRDAMRQAGWEDLGRRGANYAPRGGEDYRVRVWGAPGRSAAERDAFDALKGKGPKSAVDADHDLWRTKRAGLAFAGSPPSNAP